MFSAASLFALLAFSIMGSPVEVHNSPITLPMTRRLTFSNVTDILRHDEARVAAFREYRPASILLTNRNMDHIVSVDIGSPPRTYHLIVDSTSSITWIGARDMYVSSTGIDIKEPVAVNNVFYSFEGTMFRDTFTFTNGLTIPRMLIGVASASRGIAFDGVLGIGPRVSSRGKLQDDPDRTIPSVTDYLFWEDLISGPIVDIVNHGELTFGGDDRTKYTGSIRYTDITTAPHSSLYWGINQRITYGNTELMPPFAGIVDCSATFLYIASDAYERYRAATGGTVNNMAHGLLQISIDQYNVLDSLNFYIGEETYSLTRNAQIWPRSLNHIVFGNHNDVFLVVKSLLTPSGTRFSLQRFYTVFDADKSRIGFAQTSYTDAMTN
ncbi:aspartic peptidase domain-containing protein [Suillus spraguei]|nr:aspartic peptidase domain-containing protein [Suillus spraguei]